MKWATFTARGHLTAEPRVGVLVGDKIHAGPPGMSLIDHFGRSPDDFEIAGRRLEKSPQAVVDLAEVQLLAPIPRPPSIRDFMVFEEHASSGYRALGMVIDPDWYQIPVFYFTNPTATRGARDPIPIAPGSQQFDYEAELAAVIGWSGSNTSVSDAADLIAGYCLFIDWSARDLQAREMRLRLGTAKGKDTATTVGPFLVTQDELTPFRSGLGYDLQVTVEVNLRTYTSGSFAAMHWSFEEMISYAARGTEMQPGDIIGSGTCGQGCILELQRLHGAEEFPWLQAGDRVTVAATVLGELDHTIRESAPVKPLRTP